MTPDLDEIRQALAAAPLTQMPLAVTTTAECYGRDPLDLPPGTSLDQLWCVYDRDEDDPPWIEGMERDDAFLVANAPTWLAACISEIERLRAELLKEPQWYTEYKATEQSERIQRLVAERDAALARIAELDESIADFQQLAVDRTAERDAALAAATGSAKLALAWRACADRLAACVNHPFSRWADSSEALAVYERLRS